MDIEITQEGINEIKRSYDKISKWLLNNFCHFDACALILQTIMEKVDEVEEILKQEN